MRNEDVISMLAWQLTEEYDKEIYMLKLQPEDVKTIRQAILNHPESVALKNKKYLINLNVLYDLMAIKCQFKDIMPNRKKKWESFKNWERKLMHLYRERVLDSLLTDHTDDSEIDLADSLVIHEMERMIEDNLITTPFTPKKKQRKK